jgi:TRAP-type C4-dicarboxylate transport system substrate-binding protein
MRKFLFPGLILALLLVFAGCGGGEAEQPAPPTATTASPQAAAPATEAPAAETTEETFTFQLVSVNRTLRTFDLLEEFAERVRVRTNGQVEIQLSSYPELGISGFDSLRTIEDGSIPFQEVYSGFVGGDFPFLEMGELLGLFPDEATQIRVLKALEAEEARVVRENFNGEVLFYNYYPFQYFFSKRPLNTLADFEGLQTRTHSVPLGDLISGLGASPQTMAFADVYTALERGILDAGVTGSTPGYGQKWHEVTKYVVGPIESRPHTLITMNTTEWNRLPPNFQQIIREEGQQHIADNLSRANDWDNEGVALLEGAGMTYSEFTPAMREAIHDAVINTIVPNWVARVGGYDNEAVQIFNRIVAPVVGLKVLPDGSVEETGMAMAPSGGMAQLTSSGLDIELQYVCVNRTLRPCEHVQEFIEAVRTRTDGQVDIQLSSYPELGISGFDMIRLIDDGTVGFGEIYSGFVGGEYPAFNITNLWGAFSSPEEYFEASDAVADDMIRLVDTESNGGKVVAFNFYPINFYFSKDPINSLADFDGVRTRSHSDVLSDLIGHLGADPQTMAFADVYPALERGVLDAAVTCSTCAIGQKWFEVTKYVTGPFPGTFGQTFLTFNAEIWNGLPEDIQAIIEEEGQAHTERARIKVFEWDKAGLQELIDLGMVHAEFNDEISVNVRQAAAESVIPKWAGKAGGPQSEAVMIYNEKVAPIVGLRILEDGTVEDVK